MTPQFLRPFFLVLLLSFSVTVLLAQQPVPPQNESFKLFFENVYLHLDRNLYASGDDIWFKAYLADAQTNRPLNTSNNLYVELIDPAASIISRKLIRLDSAVGAGDFKLDDAASAGTYRIRAYTNWMRNFSHHFIFEKEIQVVRLAVASGSSSSLTKTAGTGKKSAGRPEYKIQFFPEGGSLVEDVATTVTFKAEDASGKGVEAKGYIKELTGDTVVRFTTSYCGMGSFAFTPRKGIRYSTAVQYKNNPFAEATLPVALPTGFVMNVVSADTARLLVTISSNEETTKEYPSGILNIAARHAGKSYFKQQLRLSGGKAAAIVLTKDFPAGIAYITLYDENMRPHCERLAYVEKESGVTATVSPSKPFYKPREKATVEITVADAQNRPVQAALSLSAVDNRLANEHAGTIQSYLLLQSNLPGKIENPEAYFDTRNGDRFWQCDLLLRAQGWRSFLWRQIADTNLRISFLPEAGITLSGTVTKPWSKKPMEDMNITLFAPDAKGDKVYITKTNAAGKYYLDGLPLFGTQTVKVNTGDAVGKKIGSLTVDSLSNNVLPVVPGLYSLLDTSAALTVFSTEAAKRWSRRTGGRMDNVLPGVTVSTRQNRILLEDGSVVMGFGYPEYDFTITAKDYAYQTLRDFIVQKVPGALYDEDLEGVNFLAAGRRVRPIFIIDNKEDRFGRLDYYHLTMQQVESVRIRHLVGSGPNAGYNAEDGSLSTSSPEGIMDRYLINLKIKFGDADQQLSKITTNVTGYYEGRSFYAPNYPADDGAKPDERITVHWAPLIKTDKNGRAAISFYNADPKGTIRVNVEGITEDGRPVVAHTVYEVRQ